MLAAAHALRGAAARACGTAKLFGAANRLSALRPEHPCSCSFPLLLLLLLQLQLLLASQMAADGKRLQDALFAAGFVSNFNVGGRHRYPMKLRKAEDLSERFGFEVMELILSHHQQPLQLQSPEFFPPSHTRVLIAILFPPKGVYWCYVSMNGDGRQRTIHPDRFSGPPLSLIAKPSLPLPCPCAQHSLFHQKQQSGQQRGRRGQLDCLIQIICPLVMDSLQQDAAPRFAGRGRRSARYRPAYLHRGAPCLATS